MKNTGDRLATCQTINKPLEIGVCFLFAKRRKQGECRINKYIETLRNKGW